MGRCYYCSCLVSPLHTQDVMIWAFLCLSLSLVSDLSFTLFIYFFLLFYSFLRSHTLLSPPHSSHSLSLVTHPLLRLLLHRPHTSLQVVRRAVARQRKFSHNFPAPQIQVSHCLHSLRPVSCPFGYVLWRCSLVCVCLIVRMCLWGHARFCVVVPCVIASYCTCLLVHARWFMFLAVGFRKWLHGWVNNSFVSKCIVWFACRVHVLIYPSWYCIVETNFAAPEPLYLTKGLGCTCTTTMCVII